MRWHWSCGMMVTLVQWRSSGKVTVGDGVREVAHVGDVDHSIQPRPNLDLIGAPMGGTQQELQSFLGSSLATQVG